MMKTRGALRTAAVGLALVVTAQVSQAGLLDSLFGAKPAQVDVAKRLWRIGEFTTVQIVPAEPGASPNQHPVRVPADTLRWQLGGVRTTIDGATVALFAADEVTELVEPLAEALSVAGPGDDIQVLSTSRRGGTVLLTTATGVTARVFVQDGSLQFIVHDARLEFIKDYIKSTTPPKFVFGSRSGASNVVLANSGAQNRRADWLALPLTMPGMPAAAPVAAPALPAVPLPAAGAQAPRSAPVAVAPEPPLSEVERRFQTLKRLRDRGLITEEEFQEKRKEVLKQL